MKDEEGHMNEATRSKKGNIDKNTPHDEINQRSEAFVLFYATWCRFSQRFLPIFEEYATSNPKECISVIIDNRPDVCEEYSIEYYPTVIHFRKGKAHKRLDAEPGIGLDREQLRQFIEDM